MALNGQAISADEVDRFHDALGAIDAAYSLTHRRRIALIKVCFPRTYGRIEGSGARAESREACVEWDRRRRAGNLMGPPEPTVMGNWESLSLEVFAVARELEIGAWSAIVELSGRYALIQLVGRDHNPRGGLEQFEVRIESFPYVPHAENLAERCLEAHLVIIDPAWDQVVPGYWRYTMRGAE